MHNTVTYRYNRYSALLRANAFSCAFRLLIDTRRCLFGDLRLDHRRRVVDPSRCSGNSRRQRDKIIRDRRNEPHNNFPVTENDCLKRIILRVIEFPHLRHSGRETRPFETEIRTLSVD